MVYTYCKYNTRHLLPENEVAFHHVSCPDRSYMEPFLGEKILEKFSFFIHLSHCHFSNITDIFCDSSTESKVKTNPPSTRQASIPIRNDLIPQITYYKDLYK